MLIENVECSTNLSYPDIMYQDTITCNFCKHSFLTNEDLCKHTASFHKELLNSINPADYHQSPVNETPTKFPFRCCLCNIEFEKISMLTRHVTQVHPIHQMESGNLFQCQLCPNSNVGYVMLNDLQEHDRAEHSDVRQEEKCVACPDCGRKFKFFRMLRTHLGVHVAQKPFQCSLCYKVFSWESSLRGHILKCDGTLNKPLGRPKVKNVQSNLGVKKIVQTSVKRRRKSSVQPSSTVTSGELKYSIPPSSTVSSVPSSSTMTTAEPVVSDPDNGKKFTCNECNAVFKRRELIRDHVFVCEKVLAKIRKQQMKNAAVETSENGSDTSGNAANVPQDLSGPSSQEFPPDMDSKSKRSV